MSSIVKFWMQNHPLVLIVRHASTLGIVTECIAPASISSADFLFLPDFFLSFLTRANISQSAKASSLGRKEIKTS